MLTDELVAVSGRMRHEVNHILDVNTLNQMASKMQQGYKMGHSSWPATEACLELGPPNLDSNWSQPYAYNFSYV